MAKRKIHVILLDVMFSGDYLKDNIGHEVVNLFTADNGNHYVYVNPYGHIPEKYEVDAILMVQLVKRNKLKVLAKATGLTSIANHVPNDKISSCQGIKHQYEKMVVQNMDYIRDCRVTYGNVRLDKLFNSQGDQVCVSYKADQVHFAKKELYLITDAYKDDDINSETTKILPQREESWQFSTQSLHMLIPHGADYDFVNDLLHDNSYWFDSDPEKVNLDSPIEEDTFLSIIRKEYDETIYSNMLSYYLGKQEDIAREFISWLNGRNPEIVLPSAGRIQIFREHQRIDILIRYDNCSIILENKIKSDINKSSSDKRHGSEDDQLDRYIKSLICEQYQQERGYDEFTLSPDNVLSCFDHIVDKVTPGEMDKWMGNIFPFVLHPNYSSVNLRHNKLKQYVELNYKDILGFFDNLPEMKKKDLPYYPEFRHALLIQADDLDNSNYRTMRRRFFDMIRNFN